MYCPRTFLVQSLLSKEFGKSLVIYNSLIQSHFDYCDIVWNSGLNQELTDRLQKLQNRVISQVDYETPSSQILLKLDWEDLYTRRITNTAIMMYKIISGNSTECLRECYIKRSNVNEYQLRNSEINVVIPKPRTNYFKKSFLYNGGLTWNSISKEIRSATSLGSFKYKFKAYRFSLSNNVN